VLFAVWSFNHASGKLRESRVIAEQLLAMAARVQSDLVTAAAHNAMGSTQLWMGEFSAACEHQEIVAEIYNRDIPRYLPSMQAPVIPSRCHLAWALHIGGHPDQARQRMREANDMATQLGRPFSFAFVHLYAIVLSHFRREYAEVRSRSETLIEISTEYGFPYWLAAGKMCLARTIAGEGYTRGDEAALMTGLTMMKESAEHLASSTELYLMMKRPDECLRELDQAAQRSEQMDHRLLEAEIHRLRGQTMLILPDGAAEAERCFRRAIEIAVRQQARSWELRATTSLAGLLDQRGKRDEARTMLAEISNWFTEGFDTVDVIDAKGLLEELSA
jgi:tetratricopeptide (TPR) repeat protein